MWFWNKKREISNINTNQTDNYKLYFKEKEVKNIVIQDIESLSGIKNEIRLIKDKKLYNCDCKINRFITVFLSLTLFIERIESEKIDFINKNITINTSDKNNLFVFIDENKEKILDNLEEDIGNWILKYKECLLSLCARKKL